MGNKIRYFFQAAFISGILLLSSCNSGGEKGSAASRNDTTGISIEKLSGQIAAEFK